MTSKRPPSPNPKNSVKNDRMGSLVDTAGKSAGKAVTQLSQASFLRPLRQKSFYFFAVWFLSPGILWFEQEKLLVGWGWLLLIPVFLTWGILAASAQNLKFPLTLPRSVLQIVLFAGMFLQKVNVSGRDQRPFWTCLNLWIAGLFIVFAFGLGSFSPALTGLAVALMGCSTLLF